MPDCPHCHGYYFGNPDQCPKCAFDFKLGRVVSKEESQRVREQLRIQEEERSVQATENRIRAFASSALYEYTTVYLADSRSGILDKSSLDATLQQHAAQGWRLHSVITNEAGKNAYSIGYRGVSSGTNSTMDVTILIFERCIKLAGQ